MLFANEQLPVESSAVTKLIDLLAHQDTARQFAKASPGSFDHEPAVLRVAVPPDFHPEKSHHFSMLRQRIIGYA